MLGPSDHAYDCRIDQRLCMDCGCWCKCKKCDAFLPRTPGEGILGYFCATDNVLPANPSHLRSPLPALGTEKGCAEREEEGVYSTERGEDKGDDWGKDKRGEDSKRSSRNGSSQVVDVDVTTAAQGVGRGWQQVTQL